MPNKPRTQHRSVRMDDPEWADLEDGAELVDLDRSKVINQLVDHWLRRPGAEYPPQPTQEQMDQIVAARLVREAQIEVQALKLPCPECGVEEGPCRAKPRQPADEIHRQRWKAAEKALDESAGS